MIIRSNFIFNFDGFILDLLTFLLLADYDDITYDSGEDLYFDEDLDNKEYETD